MDTRNRTKATMGDPPGAPVKAKKLMGTVTVAAQPKNPGFSGNAIPRSPVKTTKDNAPSIPAHDVNDEPEDSIGTPTASPTSANAQLKKALSMLNKMRTSGENLGIKNEVIAILEDLDATETNQPLAPPSYPQDSPEAQRITTVENDVKEIKGIMHEMKALLVANNSKPLWSTIAASPKSKTDSVHAQLQMETAKRERLEQGRQERAKTALTLTFRDASEDVCTVLKDTDESEYTSALQQAISNLKTNAKSATIRRIQKLPGKLLKIYCDNEDNAKQLRQVDWETAIAPGVTFATQEYGVVLHGVPIRFFDARTTPQQEMREFIQKTNNNIDVQRVSPLMKKPRNPSAPTQSIVIFTSSPEKANAILTDVVRLEKMNEETHIVEGMDYVPERYNTQHQIKQCFKCQAYGHKAETCTRTTTCGRCAEEHETRACTAEASKCTHCNGDHPAWHYDCPRRHKEHEKLKALIDTMPTLFPC